MVALKRTNRQRTHEAIVGNVFALIPVVGFLLFGVVPLVFSLFMSFSDVKSFKINEMQLFTGSDFFSNYASVFHDEKFGKAIVNTLEVLISLPLSMLIGLVLAAILNNIPHGKKIFSTIFFLPYVCSIVAIALMWRTLLNKNYGVINEIIRFFGGDPVAWLTDPRYFMVGMILMIVWCNSGFSMILYNAALTNISKDVYEAAKVDGAGAIRSFFSITLPLLSPTTFYLSIVGMIGCLQEFARFQAINSVNSNLISQTGPNDSGLTIVFYIYNKAFAESGGLGQAAAASWILALATILLTAFSFYGSRKWVYNDGEA